MYVRYDDEIGDLGILLTLANIRSSLQLLHSFPRGFAESIVNIREEGNAAIGIRKTYGKTLITIARRKKNTDITHNLRCA